MRPKSVRPFHFLIACVPSLQFHKGSITHRKKELVATSALFPDSRIVVCDLQEGIEATVRTGTVGRDDTWSGREPPRREPTLPLGKNYCVQGEGLGMRLFMNVLSTNHSF